MKKIGITSIGSGVGQSIVNSCRLSELPITTVGFGTNPMAYGAYDCDERDDLPTIYSPHYVTSLLEKVTLHGIDLIIPGLDDELPILSKERARFRAVGCEVLVSDESLLRICRDKELMSEVMSAHTDTYVRSYSRSGAQIALAKGEVDYPLIAKPRAGFASRGLFLILTARDLEKAGPEHVIQEIAVPHTGDPNREEFLNRLAKGVVSQVAEVSVQLLTDQNGALLGRCASYHRLNNGVPIEIIPFDHSPLWTEMDRQLPVFQAMGLRGPLNVQGRLTDKGYRFFELNARFTGITGLRAVMGFNEVAASINHWLRLGHSVSGLKMNPRKVGIRQTADRSIPRDLHRDIDRMLDVSLRTARTLPQRVLVTGATGQLGLNLVHRLAQSSDRFEVLAMGRSRAKLEKLYGSLPGVQLCESTPADLGIDLGGVDCVVHCAFTRMQGTAGEIAESLSFTQRLFELLRKHQVAKVINISSRSVYDQTLPIPCRESTALVPSHPYAMAKFATELMTRQLVQANAFVKATSLRLSVINGGLPGPTMIDFISKVARTALREGKIEVRGGSQVFDVLNVGDAVSAILKLIEMPERRWAPEYNLGSGAPIGILDLVEIIREEVESSLGDATKVRLTVTKDPSIKIGYALDCDALSSLIGWRPQIAIRQTVREAVLNLINEGNTLGQPKPVPPANDR